MIFVFNVAGAVKRNLAVTARILLEAGIPVDTKDHNGDTALLLVKNLITELSSDVNDVQLASSEAQMSEIKDLLSVLVLEYKASLNALDAKGRSLLTYSVEAGDRCLALTRFLINLGAKTFRYAFKMYFFCIFCTKL